MVKEFYFVCLVQMHVLIHYYLGERNWLSIDWAFGRTIFMHWSASSLHVRRVYLHVDNAILLRGRRHFHWALGALRASSRRNSLISWFLRKTALLRLCYWVMLEREVAGEGLGVLSLSQGGRSGVIHLRLLQGLLLLFQGKLLDWREVLLNDGWPVLWNRGDILRLQHLTGL